MIDSKLFEICGEIEIRQLKGGPIRGNSYWIAVLNDPSDKTAIIIRAQLRNQLGTQTSPAYPKGYEPFIFCAGEHRFCLHRMEISLPQIQMVATGISGPLKPTIRYRPTIRYTRKPAFILREPRDCYRTDMLEEEARRFENGHALRRLVEGNLEKLLIGLELLMHSKFRRQPPIEVKEAAKLFEMQLLRSEMQKLSDLIGLLQLPDNMQPSVPTAALGQAA